MGILGRMRSLFGSVDERDRQPPTSAVVQAGITPIGQTAPECPYCSFRFPKMPQRKTACPSCKNPVFSRTRPFDNSKVLLRDTELEAIGEQWAIVNGTHQAYLHQRERRCSTENALEKQFGRTPVEFEVQWQLLNDDAAVFARERQWGLYRNARFGLGELLRRQGQDMDALRFFLEVCYLDLNGPENRGGLDQFPELAAKYPGFDPALSMLAPGVVGRCQNLLTKLNLDRDALVRAFLDVAGKASDDLALPIGPESAWERLATDLSLPKGA